MDEITRMTDPNNLPSVMTSKEVAAFCGINLKTVYDAHKRKELPGVRVGRILRHPREEVLKWLKGNVSHS